MTVGYSSQCIYSLCIVIRRHGHRVVHVLACHDDVIRVTGHLCGVTGHLCVRRYWPFVLGIHRSRVNSPHKGQWREALMFSLTCAWINGWVNNRWAGDLRRHRAHYDVTLMCAYVLSSFKVGLIPYSHNALSSLFSSTPPDLMSWWLDVILHVFCSLFNPSEYGLFQWEKALHMICNSFAQYDPD